ncbi:MAG: hypothetical protein ACHQ51_04215 [Elusimicrobiota bacterium]
MNKIIIAAAAIAVFGMAGAFPARAQDEAAGGDKTFEADKGPETVDVSKYPKEQQENYKVFSEKCAKCHTLARPINSQYALPEEWTAYVDKMRHKKRSGIDDDSQKTITDFLIYDSSVRKKELIAQKLKDKAAAEAAGGKKDAAKPDEKAAPAAKP